MSAAEFLMYVLIAVLVALPTRYDPAVRFKDWLRSKNNHNGFGGTGKK